MTDIERQKKVYAALKDVYSSGAYCGIALDKTLREIADDKDKAYITALFYDVLERDVTLSYYVDLLCDRRPKTAISILIKIGMCEMTEKPAYAVINTTVDLCKAVGKRDSAGFVNAILRKYSSTRLALPSDETERLSVESSTPLWITREVVSEYGLDQARNILLTPPVKKTHVRPNLRKTTKAEFYAKFSGADKTDYGVFLDAKAIKTIPKGNYAIMSLSSAVAVNYYRAGIENSGKILDVCAAPGGKSVYLSELGDYDITACDVHPHRVKLINSYARTMSAKIKTVTNDATILNTEWQNAFGAVICDVPCSGIGVRSSKPDVFLNRKQEDIAAIVGIQRKILDVSSYYVRSGGTLFYSTCTILKRENDEVVNDFLSSHPQFELLPLKAGNYECGKDGFLRLLPDGKGLEGFFVAAFKRK